jgi:hypothetical protein
MKLNRINTILPLFIASFIFADEPEEISPQVFSKPVPANLQEEADKSFAAGANYFIWLNRPITPLPFGNGFLGEMDYCVRPSGPATSFVTYVTFSSKNASTGEAVAHTAVIDAYGTSGDKPIWKILVTHMADGTTLKGKGTVTVYLINRSDREVQQPKPISNVATAEVAFGK